jgi:hypothetical protein
LNIFHVVSSSLATQEPLLEQLTSPGIEGTVRHSTLDAELAVLYDNRSLPTLLLAAGTFIQIGKVGRLVTIGNATTTKRNHLVRLPKSLPWNAKGCLEQRCLTRCKGSRHNVLILEDTIGVVR